MKYQKPATERVQLIGRLIPNPSSCNCAPGGID